MYRIVHLISLLLLFFISQYEAAKITETVVFNKQRNFKYLGKFLGSNIKGTNLQYACRGKFKRKIQVLASINVDKYKTTVSGLDYEFYVYLGEDRYISALQSQSCQARRDLAYQYLPLHVPLSGQFQPSVQVKGQEGRIPGHKFLYFVIADCLEPNHEHYLSLPAIEVQLQIVQKGKKQFSYQDSSTLRVYSIAFVLILLTMGQTIFEIIKEFRSSFNLWEDWDQSPMLLILISVSCFFSSIVLKLVHLLVYATNGQGLLILDIFAIMGDMASQTVTSLVLMLLAYGWTIKHAKVQDIELFIPVFFVLLIVNIVVASLTYVTKGEATKYHDFSGAQGWILVFFRMCQYAGFVTGCYLSKSEMRNPQIKQFFMKTLMSGSLYLLGFPILMIIVNFFAYHYQQFVMHIGVLGINFIALSLMIYQFSSKGEYYKASIKSSTILPDKWQ